MMSDGIAKPSFWQRFWAFRYVHFVILFVVTNIMYVLAQLIAIVPAAVHAYSLHLKGARREVIEHYDYGVSGGLLVVIGSLLLSALLIWGYVALSRWLERRQDSDFALTRMPQRLALGTVIGFVLLTGSIGLQWLLGDAQIAVGHQFIFSAPTIIPVICAPIFEELIMRGVVLRIFEKMYGSWVALVISAALFGFAHIANPHASVLAAISIAIEAGLLLGMAYITTRSLWLPIGLHFGWNFTEGDFWGAPDSGNAIHGIFETTTHGNALITGGTFGPEASIITPAFCLAAAALLYRTAQQRGNWQPLRRQHFGPIAA